MMIDSLGEPLNMETGLIYRVEFDDGTKRRMRHLVQQVKLCHAWVDLKTSQVVVQTWLARPGRQSKGQNPMLFSHPEGDPFPSAFGGAIVTRMALDVSLGGVVSWASQAGGSNVIKTGVVEEVVPGGACPNRERFPQLYRASGVGLPRKHVSYVVRVQGKTSKSNGTLYWPRISSLTAN